VFCEQKLEKIYSKKKTFFDQKGANNISLGLHKERKATEETFSPQKRTYSTSKYEISLLFKFCGEIFALPEPDLPYQNQRGSGSATKINTL
jgi:hypothetical protein